MRLGSAVLKYRMRIHSYTRAFFSFAAIILAGGCDASNELNENALQGSPYLLMFAGDKDRQESDFVMVMDIDPVSERRGQAISSVPIGHNSSMPHHMEYVPPPKGEPVFMNAHHHELSLMVDVSDPSAIKIDKTFLPPDSLRFPHDYTRTPSGTRLVGFLRSDGKSPTEGDDMLPGNHGGIAEYTIDGDLIRTASAAVEGASKPIRPYAFTLLVEQDRLVVTSAPMMENVWADVVQIFRYSDFELLHTLELPVGHLANGQVVEGSQAAGFGPRALDDGSVFFNSYGCAFYHLTDIASDEPKLETVLTLKTKAMPNPNKIRGACGVPYRIGDYWIQPAGQLNKVVVLDISDPKNPQKIFDLRTPKDFRPHWLAKDPKSDRLVLGAELDGEQGFYILRFNEQSGELKFDKAYNDRKGKGLFSRRQAGYISLENKVWPHGDSGDAWGHAALFIDP